VQAAGTRLVLDKTSGQITSWRVGDEDVLLGGPILNLGESLPPVTVRAGGNNRNRPPPPVASPEPPQLRHPAVTAAMDGPNARLEVTADVYLAGTNELQAQLKYTIEINPEAGAEWTWKLDWMAAEATAREAGFKFLLPAATDRLAWFGDSLFPEYPADHIGNPRGSISVRDGGFASPRRNLHWAALAGAGRHPMVALASGPPLHLHGRVETNGVLLFLSSGIASTGRDVTGDTLRLTQATPLTGGFRLRVAAGANP
jgi:hypothetical protein